MADFPLGSGEPNATAPGAAFINLTPPMRGFYAARGMWHDGKPCGWLASMLGDPTPWQPTCGASFWVTAAQLQALEADLRSSQAAVALGTKQVAQFVRRLREAAVRSLPRHAVHALQRGGGASVPTATQTVPFTPLVAPLQGRAGAAFSRHVFDCVREVVDFAQTSAYGA